MDDATFEEYVREMERLGHEAYIGIAAARDEFRRVLRERSTREGAEGAAPGKAGAGRNPRNGGLSGSGPLTTIY